MSSTIEIFGSVVTIPERVNGFIENWGTDNPKEQYWRRKDLPEYFSSVEYDKEGNALLTLQQREYALEEVRRCKEGFWFFNKGVETYITAKNYFYLQWWKLEDDIYPDYRDLDRRYFLFLNHWEKTPFCLGVIIGKKRRQGATSVATSNLVYECIFFKNSFCGLTSKTQIDAKTAFTNMVAFGYRQLPVFLKPKQLNNKDSVSELVFAHKSVDPKGGTASAIDSDLGHRSKIDYRAPSLNSYDSGRLSRGLLDEGSKLPKEVPFSTFISIISKTLIKGAKRVGFLECPSTTNAMTNGGEEFKKVWESADQFKYGKKTPNRLVKYMTPAYDGYMGFIDRYGISVIDPPDEDQFKYLVENFVGAGDLEEADVRLGAKQYLLERRKHLTGAELEEEVRMNPFSEKEMFMYSGTTCEFNSTNILNQIDKEENTPSYWRQSRLVLKTHTPAKIFPTQRVTEKTTIGFMDDEKCGWFILEEPIKPNYFKYNAGYFEPLNTMLYQVGVDTTQDRVAIAGSNPAITVFKKSLIIDGEETGMYPVALWISPTRLDIHFDEEVKKACLWYGCKANYEVDRRTDFYRYFCKENCQALLTWTPKILMNPLKPNKQPEYGSRSGDPFQLAQMLQISKWYIDGDSQDEYNGHVHRIKSIPMLKQALEYNHLDRTKSDLFVSLQMALVAVFGDMTIPPKKQDQRGLVLPQHKIKIPA
jgi:hypothetical protein